VKGLKATCSFRVSFERFFMTIGVEILVPATALIWIIGGYILSDKEEAFPRLVLRNKKIKAAIKKLKVK
jgi:hypothetical protein